MFAIILLHARARVIKPVAYIMSITTDIITNEVIRARGSLYDKTTNVREKRFNNLTIFIILYMFSAQ